MGGGFRVQARLGFGVWGLGLMVWCLGFAVLSLGLGLWRAGDL